MKIEDVAAHMNTSMRTVSIWSSRFEKAGLDGLAAGSVPSAMVTLAVLSLVHQSQAARSLITVILCGSLLVTPTASHDGRTTII
jgi:hypothetical protein